MAATEQDVIPVVEAVDTRYEDAALWFDKALKAGAADPEAAYLLALAYKRQGKTGPARDALRKVPRPDANVWLQMGLLSLAEEDLPQAEQEFARSLEMAPDSYPACHNLLLTRLTLGQMGACQDLLPRALELAPGDQERRFLHWLEVLLANCPRPAEGGRQKAEGSPEADRDTAEDDGAPPRPPVSLTLLRDLPAEDEARLLQVIRSLGQPDPVLALLKTLKAGRPQSPAVYEALVEATLVKARSLVDRCDWLGAEKLLTNLLRDKAALGHVAKATQAAVLNLLGCCACFNQDPTAGARHFQAALWLAPQDPRLHQNLALAYQWQGDLAKADPHWNRYIELADDRLPSPPGFPNYDQAVVFEALTRLAASYSEKEQWGTAVRYVERAHRLRPNDGDVLERLFLLYQQAKRTGDARKALARLRELRPGEPQYELYELDLLEIKSLNDIDRTLTAIDRIRQRHPNDARVEDKAVSLVGSVIPLMGNLCDKLTDEMSRVIDQVRRLPNYQINWSAVHEAMRDLLREFQKLRRITSKCLPLVRTDEQRRIVRDLAEHIDRKIEVCREMGA